MRAGPLDVAVGEEPLGFGVELDAFSGAMYPWSRNVRNMSQVTCVVLGHGGGEEVERDPKLAQ